MAKAKTKTPERTAANDAFDQVLDVNERILKEIYEAYSLEARDSAKTSGLLAAAEPKLSPSKLRPKEEGIMAICHKLGVSCIAPRRKINVMIVGNHSAGKSSYIKCARTPVCGRARASQC